MAEKLPENCPGAPNSKRTIFGIRVVEALVIAAITAGATGYVSLRVVEARADSDREAIQELKVAMKENTKAINQLTALASNIEIRTEERSRVVESRLRALEERRR